MEVSFEVNKIIKYAIYSNDGVLLNLSLIEQIIKDANLLWISFIVKHPQRFFGIMNEFVQNVQSYFQYVYTPI